MKKIIIFSLIIFLGAFHFSLAAILGTLSTGEQVSNSGSFGCRPFQGQERQDFVNAHPELNLVAVNLTACPPLDLTTSSTIQLGSNTTTTPPPVVNTPVNIPPAPSKKSAPVIVQTHDCTQKNAPLIYMECAPDTTVQDVSNAQTDLETRVEILERKYSDLRDGFFLLAIAVCLNSFFIARKFY